MSCKSLYRLALWALPADLRLKHGAAMEALFLREIASMRGQGRLRVAILALRGIGDALRRGIYERGRRAVGAPRRRKNRSGRWGMDGVRQDVSHGLRSLMKAPGFTAVVVLTLALGMGATTAVFSVLNAVLLKPLPFPDPGRVVNLAWEGGGHLQSALSATKFMYWKERARSLDAVATWQYSLLSGDEGTTGVLHVTPDFFRVVGLAPALGRSFRAEEHVHDGPTVAVVSDRTWQSRFGGDPDVVGRTLRLGDEALVVVGVLPEAFGFPYESGSVDAIVPLHLPPADPEDIAENWPAIARLADGSSLAEAREEVTSLNGPFGATYPAQGIDRGRGMRVAGFNELYVIAGARHALRLLLGGVGLVLLIACANAANLFFVRASGRQGEVAVRAALGASPGRITRLVLTESLLVAVTAGVVGLLLATWLVELLVGLSPVEIPGMASVGVDWRVLSFTFAIALGTGLAFGSPAAWPAARSGLSKGLKERSRGSAPSRRGRQGLLAAQAALSTILLTAAGFLVGTLISLNGADPGWDPRGTFSVRLQGGSQEFRSPENLWDLQRRVLERVVGSPLVASIAGASSLPLERGINVPITIAGQIEHSGTVEWRAVTPGYFQTLRIASVVGRTFHDTDLAGDIPVAIVNEAFVRSFFPHDDPLGHRIELGSFQGVFADPAFVGSEVEIVGVVADVRETSLRSEPRRTLYVPQAQASSPLSGLLGNPPVFLVRSNAGQQAVHDVLSEALAVVDPTLSRPDVVAFEDIVAASLARERFGATLLSVLAGLALVLTGFGIYGTLAHIVKERRREIGIRMALGAKSRHVTRMVVLQGTGPVLIGLALGVGGSLALSGLLRPFLWGVTPTEPWMFAAVSSVLLGVAFMASWIPARDAAGIQPAKTLQSE